MLNKKAAAVNAKITKADTQAVTRAVFNAAGVDYPAAADTFRKADAIVTIDGLTFPAWKSTYCRNASPVYISDNMAYIHTAQGKKPRTAAF